MWEELFGKIGLWVLPLMILAWVVRELWGVAKHQKVETQSGLIKVQFEDFKSFQSKIIKAEADLDNLYYLDRPIGLAPPKVDIIEVIKELRELNLEAKRIKTWFPQKFADKIQDMVEALQSYIRALEFKQIMIAADAVMNGDDYEEYEKSMQQARSLVPTVLEELERFARKHFQVD